MSARLLSDSDWFWFLRDNVACCADVSELAGFFETYVQPGAHMGE